MTRVRADYDDEPEAIPALPTSSSGVLPLRPAAVMGTTPEAITDMLNRAVTSGVPVEALEKLVALHERVSDRLAASEFAAALSDFQRACPIIARTSTAKVATKSGGSWSYNFADLAEIVRAVRPLLHERGFSYSWDSEVRDKLLHVTCTLRHVNGHKETSTFACPVESSGGMTEQQKYGAALSYARRNSLTQILGITSADPDDDGAGHKSGALINGEQVGELRRLADDVGADVPKFLAYVGYPTFEEIPAEDFSRAKNALLAKRRGRK